MPRNSRRVSSSLTYWTGFSCVLLLLVWIFQNVIGENTGLTALLTYIPQHGWAILPVILLVLALFRRQVGLVAINALALLFWGKFLFGFCIPVAAERTAAVPSVRVMSYNIALGKFGQQGLIETIRAHEPDVLCLQESQVSTFEQATSTIDDIQKAFPDWKMHKTGDVLTMSHLPLVSTREFPLRDGSRRRILETTYQTSKGPLRLLNVHVSTAFKGGGYARETLHSAVPHVIANARPAAQARLEQIPTIQAAIEADQRNTPMVMVGDFNTTPRGLFYRHWRGQLTDAFEQAGWGTGVTYPARLPLLRIDYAFLGNGVRAKRAFVGSSRASDHLPLIVDVVLP